MIKTIEECFYQIQNGANIKQGDFDGGFPITRIETTANDKFNRDRMGYAGITDISKYKSYVLEDGDLLMSHINSTQYLGRTVLYVKKSDEIIIHGMNLLRLKARRDLINPAYAKYCFYGHKFRTQIGKITKKSVNQASFAINDLKRIKINVPSLKEQEMIVAVLDKLQNLIDLRNKEIEMLNNLIKSRFIELFGDMYLNSKGWPEAKLESMADVVSGITKGRKTRNEDLTEVPYMAVSNVKDGYIDWTTVKTIEATQQEIEQYRLLPDDVLMTEGGDPDKVGRGSIIKKPLENCIHQNHIFRVRLDESALLPEFFAEYLQHQRSKRYFLGCAKQTTGIASINMKQLRALPVLVPSLTEQAEFVSFKAEVDKSKLAVQQGLQELETLKKSLMQEYFG